MYVGNPSIATSSPRNLMTREGHVVFGGAVASAPTATSGLGSLVLYTDGTSLKWWNGSSTTTLGATGGSGSAPSWDAIYVGDQALAVSGSALTIDGTHASNDVFAVTNTGAGSGDLIQLTNTGTGKDINGTSSTWSVTATGVAVFEEATIDGTEGSNVFTVTKGDVRFLDSSLAVTDDDNAASFTLTNDTATTASVAVIAGSGAFTGSTTTSFMTITPSGLTTGTAVYLPVAALTTGKALHVVGNAVTSGILMHIASSVASTTLTGAGRLFKVDHTGNATGTGILSEFNSAAADETVIVKITASAALAAGVALQVSGSSVTTGKAITAADLDALTTGMGLHIASAATAITTTGRLLYVNHTGVTSTSGTLVEFASSAADETIVVGITANDLATGTMLNFGTNIALTTGVGLKMLHTTSVIADTGSMLRLSSTGINTGGATNGTMLDVQTTLQVAGTQNLFQAGAVTTGVVVSIISTTGMTSGSLLRATSSTAGAIATNGAISFRATGAFTSTSNVGFLDVLASATTAGTVVRIASSAAGQTATELLRVDASGFTTGYTGNVVNIVSASTTGASNALLVTTAASTAGTGIKVVANSLTTGTGLLVTSSGTITSAGEGLVNIVGTGITTGDALKIDLTEGTLTTGKYINCYDDTGTTSVFSVGENGAVLHSDFTEVVTGTNVITAAESGSVFFLNSATEFVSTLPAVQAGLHFTFIVTAAPVGASYTVVTDSSANVMLGTVHSSDGVDGDSELAGCDTVNFVDGAAVVGDRLEVWCDGTNWFGIAHCNVSTGVTYTTAS